jgi:hypothetical protein
MEFLTFYDILEKKMATHGAIVSAAEDLGFIYGFDRFGRFRRFTLGQDKDRTDIEKALNDLFDDFDYYGDIYNQDPDPRDLLDPFHPLQYYGWPFDQPIDFKKYESDDSVPPMPVPKTSRKKESNELRLIGALVSCLCGQEKQGASRENINSEANLIRFMEKRFNGYPGFSKRSLEEKFASAKNLLDNS